MNNLIRTFLHTLHDRVIGSLGSMIGATFSTFRAVHHAEQISFLEDLARQYEADGKPKLAEQVRLQAANLNMDDPATEALPVFRNVLADQNELPLLCDDPNHDAPETAVQAEASPAKKKRRGRKAPAPTNDMGVSLD